MEPGALEKLPSDISAVVKGSKINLVGSMVTYREVDLGDGKEKWIDNLNIGNAIYYLHIGFNPEGVIPGFEGKDKGSVTVRIHEMVIKDDGVKYLAEGRVREIPIRDEEDHDKQQVQAISPGPAVTTVDVAPLKIPTDDIKMYDVPEPSEEDKENIETLAKNSNLALARALVASTEIGDKDLLTWKQVCNVLARGEISNKFYIALKNSKFRGKTLDGDILVEVANFLEAL